MNILSALLLQLCTIASGFVIPKIILSYFGSEVNGLISSVNQFLNYVQLLEGGLSGVVMAALYKALAEKNYEKVSAIIKAVKSFFKKIALIYIVYALVMAFVYPLIVHNDFDYWYVVTLIVIISVNLFIQYLFSLTYRLLLTSDRRGYIVSFTQTAFIILNLVFVIVSVKLYPNIHIMKLISAVAFLIQPIVFGIYVNTHYKIDKKAAEDKSRSAPYERPSRTRRGSRGLYKRTAYDHPSGLPRKAQLYTPFRRLVRRLKRRLARRNERDTRSRGHRRRQNDRAQILRSLYQQRA